MEDYAVLIVIGAVILSAVVYLYSIVWAYGDAERRGKSGCLVALLVMLVSWPLGIVIWLVARPEPRRFDIDDRRSN